MKMSKQNEKKNEDKAVNKKIYNYINWVFEKKFSELNAKNNYIKMEKVENELAMG